MKIYKHREKCYRKTNKKKFKRKFFIKSFSFFSNLSHPVKLTLLFAIKIGRLCNNRKMSYFGIFVSLSNNKSNHNHKKRKDSLETRAVFSWFSMLTWNLGGGPSDFASTFFKMANAYGNFLYDNDFHAVITIIGC